MSEKVKLTIDGKVVEVAKGTTVFNAAKQMGIEIPHFCYHPKLSIAGNCRLCQVEVEGARGPVISCKEVVREGMVVQVNSDGARQVRKDVLEFILVNHPLDCPVCDQSGECKLQDQYFDHSLQNSRMQEAKIHKPKAKPIGPHVHLDDERCVLCTRCIRFCDEVVGSHELMMRERGGYSTIDVLPGRELDNKYSLCTVDLCPVGALTSSDFRFKKRVWFLASTPSVCTGCATGCNVLLDHHDKIFYRMRPRENEDVNQCWACDDGRMTYKQLNAQNRTLFPMLLAEGEYKRISWDAALNEVHHLLENLSGDEIACVLSAQCTNEENIAFSRFARESLGVSDFYWTGLDEDKAFADKLLRDADRNPNTYGVKMMASKRISKSMKEKVVFVLGNLSDAEVAILSSLSAKVIWVTESAVMNRRFADVVFPRATYAEQDGTFINKKGILQRIHKAFEPHGESVPVWTLSARLTNRWGKLAVAASADQVFETEKTHYKPLAAASFYTIPQVGVQL
ncbi:MAG: NADH-quinone oxidoreductase subunit G [Deltaproteobacteria bacterium CG_4_10_14_0_2_um_filter_43_8]|nr:MAG: NADH-quinone oxidoreductase subunit G [Deltaproteobacteria bacterium CG11_big_fil_rev_8_21_14_0_20_42_23]PJA21953.1 MAG: NADH-quinone oxidoreductase subunit G [Deltaproteobacteria bacterium CG_4_10_14_0_2_um_filter_43_8]PJC64746.1 MAG: NADH-quinone oxidoreductase subunit G [Deltaproteobacteria bacterium CG_4_9_14_0_2_um_filter_42_21]